MARTAHNERDMSRKGGARRRGSYMFISCLILNLAVSHPSLHPIVIRAGVAVPVGIMSDDFISEMRGLSDDLQSDKVTIRKEGLRRLNGALDQPDFLRALDEATLHSAARDHRAGATWPTLALLLVNFIWGELKPGHLRKKGPDAALSRTFRKLVQCAEDVRRTGRKDMLLSRAPKLFRHVRDVLQQQPPSTPIGGDYTAVLRSYFLPAQRYCAATPVIVFQDLLDVYMKQLEAGEGLQRGEDTFRAASTLALLLEHFQGDMSSHFREATLQFFCDLFPRLFQLREEGRLAGAVLGGANAFLLRVGADVRSGAPRLHASAHALLQLLLKNSREARLPETVLTYLRIQLNLGGLQGVPGAVEDVDEALDRILHQAGFSWHDNERSGAAICTAAQHSLLLLTARLKLELASRQGSRGSRTGSYTDDAQQETQHPAKRRRIESATPLKSLPDLAFSRPALWYPVLATLVAEHAYSLPAEVLASWVSSAAVAAAVQQSPGTLEPPVGIMTGTSPSGSGRCPLSVAGPDRPGSPDHVGAIWFLRYIAELAGADGCTTAASRPNLHERSTAWQATWDAIVGWLGKGKATSAGREAALLALGRVAQQGLVPLHSRVSLWALLLALCKESGPTQALAGLVVACFGHGRGASGGAEARARQELIDCLLPKKDIPPEHPLVSAPLLVAESILVLLGLSPTPASDYGAASRCLIGGHSGADATLQWWQPDSAAALREPAIAGLVGGKEWAQACAARHRRAAANEGGIGGTGGKCSTSSTGDTTAPAPTGPGPPARTESQLVETAAAALQALLEGLVQVPAVPQGRPQSVEGRPESVEQVGRTPEGGRAPREARPQSLRSRLSACCAAVWVVAGVRAAGTHPWGPRGAARLGSLRGH
eukprot:jgi/Botrbrau1/5788/Bobra.0155s0011.1